MIFVSRVSSSFAYLSLTLVYIFLEALLPFKCASYHEDAIANMRADAQQVTFSATYQSSKKRRRSKGETDGEEERERKRASARQRDAWLRHRCAAKSNLKEWLVHLFHGRNNSLLNTLPSRTFQGVCWHYAALSTAQWRIVPPPRSSTFSTVRKYRGIEIGGRQLLLLATLEKLNLIWLVPEILRPSNFLSVARRISSPFLTLSHSSSLFPSLFLFRPI